MTRPLPVLLERHELGVTARLLFLPEPTVQSGTVAGALSALRTVVLRHLRSDDSFDLPSPAFTGHRLTGKADLRSEVVPWQLLVAELAEPLAHIGYVPALDLWLQIRGDLATAAGAAIERELQRRRRDDDARPLPLLQQGRSRAWTTTLSLHAELSAVRTDDDDRRSTGRRDVGTGAQELRRVGRDLLADHPDRLGRAHGRETLLAELEARLEHPRRRALLLLGPSGTGKTALVHELAWRRAEARSRSGRTDARQRIWHVPAARLVAGMSYQGQWETRFSRILAHAQGHDHVLWFDDLLGLLTAGQHSASTLSAADLLAASLVDGQCRVLAEITPGAWRVLRERHRGLAEVFQVVPVPPTLPAETARVLLHTARAHQRELRPEVQALAAGLGSGAEPGRSVRALLHGVDQPGVRAPSRRPAEEMAERVRQQPAMPRIAADLCHRRAAGMLPAERPFATLLFVGPTGVGKTEAAKALAGLVFGNADLLLRFDMNQYATAAAAARLIGTFHDPDGQLTAAVRQTPFAVLLLDEIEKAHPHVHDLLLQVLGEGRLTDARGRTVDFRWIILVMTSNLGADRAAAQVGFDPAAGDALWLEEVRRFFRPEFCNRIDQVVPFQTLAPTTVADLLDSLLQKLVRRDAFVRRRLHLQVDAAARAWLCQRGYDRTMGARALKRTVERQLVAPLARSLAADDDPRPAWVEVTVADDQLQLFVHHLDATLADPDPGAAATDPWAALVALRRDLDAIAPRLARTPLEFGPGATTTDPHALAVRQQFDVVRGALHDLELELEPREAGGPPTDRGWRGRRKTLAFQPSLAGWRTLCQLSDVRAFLQALPRLPDQRDRGQELADQAHAELAALRHLLAGADELAVRILVDGDDAAVALMAWLLHASPTTTANELVVPVHLLPCAQALLGSHMRIVDDDESTDPTTQLFTVRRPHEPPRAIGDRPAPILTVTTHDRFTHLPTGWSMPRRDGAAAPDLRDWLRHLRHTARERQP